MIWDFLVGLTVAFLAFFAIILLCGVIGKIAGFFSPYNHIK